MVKAKQLGVGSESSLAEGERFGRLAAREKQAGQIGAHVIRDWMRGTACFLVDTKDALEEWPRPNEVALGVKQEGEVVEARRRVWMLGAEHFLADC